MQSVSTERDFGTQGGRASSTPWKKNVPPPTDPGMSSVTEGSDTLSCIEVDADETLM